MFTYITSVVKPVHFFMARNRVSKSRLKAELCFHRYVHFACVPIYIFYLYSIYIFSLYIYSILYIYLAMKIVPVQLLTEQKEKGTLAFLLLLKFSSNWCLWMQN